MERLLGGGKCKEIVGNKLCPALRELSSGTGAKRKETKVQGTFVPLSGLATEGKPRAFKRSRSAKRRKYRLRSGGCKKA